MKACFTVFTLFGIALVTNLLGQEPVSPELGLARTYAKLQKIASGEIEQLRIGIVGDSVANNKAKFLIPRFEAEFGAITRHSPGWSGAAVLFEGDALMGRRTGGNPYDHTYSWLGTHLSVQNGGALIFHGGGGAGVTCNRIVLYFEVGPNRGACRLLRSTSPTRTPMWIVEEGFDLMDTYSDVPGWRKIVINAPLGPQALRIEHLSGDPVVMPVSPVYQNNAERGVVTYHLRRGGLGLLDANRWDPDFAQDYLSEIDLDLAIFEMKEHPSYFAEQLEVMGETFRKAMPSLEWILILSSPIGYNHDRTQTKQILENEMLQAFGDKHGYYVFDGYSLIGTYDRMVELNWHGDSVHEAPEASAYLEGELWKEIGFLLSPRIEWSFDPDGITTETGAIIAFSEPGESTNFKLILRNTGTIASGDLATEIAGDPQFGHIPYFGSLQVGESTRIPIAFTPDELREHQATFRLRESGEIIAEIPLSGLPQAPASPTPAPTPQPTPAPPLTPVGQGISQFFPIEVDQSPLQVQMDLVSERITAVRRIQNPRARANRLRILRAQLRRLIAQDAASTQSSG